MRMFCSIRFNRTVDPRRHYLMPGGYEVVLNDGRKIQFDFLTSAGNVSLTDPTVVNFCAGNLDLEAFPDAKVLESYAGGIDRFEEFYVYTGEDQEERVFPVELLGFELVSSDGRRIPINPDAFGAIWGPETYGVDNLIELYNKNEVFYYCNSCGEINLPGDTSPLVYHDEEELPLPVRELFSQYWTDNSSSRNYVVELRNEAALTMSFLVCETYVSDIIGRTPGAKEMNKVYGLVAGYAGDLHKSNLLCGCSVAVGQYSDPDGHELEVSVPYDRRENIPYIMECLNNIVYHDLDLLIKEAFGI